MKLENKILLLVVGLVLILGLFSFLVQRYVVYDRFVEIDYAEAKQDVMRCVEAIRGEENHLAKLATDWAAWDDTYDFVSDRNERFINTNLVSESFSTLDVNLISISDTAGKPIWRHLRYKDKEYPLDSFPEITFTPRSDDTAASRPRVTTGIVKVGTMALVIAAVEIRKSNFGGPSRGVLVMGRVLDRRMMSQFGRQTKVEMSISWNDNNGDSSDNLKVG